MKLNSAALCLMKPKNFQTFINGDINMVFKILGRSEMNVKIFKKKESLKKNAIQKL